LSDYPDFGPPSGRPGYGSSYQAAGAAISNVAETVELVSVSGRGVYLGSFIDINGPDSAIDYLVMIKIDGNIYFYDDIEDILLNYTSFGGGPRPKMSLYKPSTGHHCFSHFITSSFWDSLSLYAENGSGVPTIFNGKLYYSLVEES